jgi:putative transcriptional regulator
MASTKEDFGVRVRALRRTTGLSQEHFADRVGVSRTHMGKIETGKANPTLEIIVRLAKGLDLSLADLFTTLDRRPDWPQPAAK